MAAMNRKLYFIYNSLLLLIICLLYSIGLCLFSNGFLVVRKHIEKKSSCAESSTQLLSSIENSESSARDRTPGCGFGGRYERAVIVMTDGLAFDFAVNNDTIRQLFNTGQSIPYLINDFNQKYEKNSKVFKLWHKSSLSSTQDFQSLITGGLQTFLQWNSEFKPFDLIEDNLIYQLHFKSKRATLVADIGLNGSHVADWFDKTVFFGPQNTDFDTKLIKQMESSDWHLLISRMPNIDLSVTDRSQTNDHLTRIKQLLDRIAQAIKDDNKTVAFIIGNRFDKQIVETYPKSDSFVLAFSSEPLPLIERTAPQIELIDLVPTLSLLLGVPIPFSNMGKAISPLFRFPMDCKVLRPTPEFACHEDIESIRSLWTSISALRINVAQFQRYINLYSQVSHTMPKKVQRRFDELLERYDRNWVLLNHIPSDNKLATIQSLIELNDNYDHYLTQLRTELKVHSASVDIVFLSSGLIVLFLSCAANMAAIYCLSSHQSLINMCTKSVIGLAMGALTAQLLRVINLSFHETNVYDTLFLSAVTSIVMSIGFVFTPKILSFVTSKRIHFFSRDFLKNSMSLETIFTIIFIAFNFSSFSKTLIINEETITHFTFQSLLILFLIDHNMTKVLSLSRNGRTLVLSLSMTLLVVTRFSKQTLHCHNERFNCNSSEIRPQSSSPNHLLCCFLFLIPILSSLIYILDKYQEKKEYNLSVTFIKYSSVVSILSLFGHYSISMTTPLIRERLLSDNQLILAKTVLYSNIFLLIVLILFSLRLETQNTRINRLSISTTILWLSASEVVLLFNNKSYELIIFSITAILLLIISRQISDKNYSILIIIWYFMSSTAFFTATHFHTIDSINFNNIFSEQSNSIWDYIIPVIVRVFSFRILSALSLPLLVSESYQTKEDNYWKLYMNLILKYILLNGIQISLVALSSSVMRNDAMVWSLFATRFVYNAIGFHITLVAICFVYLFTLRIIF